MQVKVLSVWVKIVLRFVEMIDVMCDMVEIEMIKCKNVM